MNRWGHFLSPDFSFRKLTPSRAVSQVRFLRGFPAEHTLPCLKHSEGQMASCMMKVS
jgi:hypothetical protein